MDYQLTKEVLGNRIWCTKKARQNAEARLVKTDNILSFFLAYYSVVFAAFQLATKFLTLNSTVASQLDWISTSFSLFILCFSLIISGNNFKLKAEKMKNCYLELSDLEGRLGFNSSFGLEDAAKEYTDILKRAENHISWDYETVFMWRKLSKTEDDLSLIIRHIKHVSIVTMISLLILFGTICPLVILYKYIYPSL